MTTRPRLIALCSPAMYSGKSTAAAHLAERHGFVKIAFATPLKSMTIALLRSVGMSGQEITERVYGHLKEEMIPELGTTSRHIQQTLGTEWGRKLIKESLWVDITLALAARCMADGKSVVIDDMRFPNEYEAIHALGGETWRIVRPDTPVTVAHASEGQLDGIHMREVRNDGSIEDLHMEIDRLIESLF